MVRLFDAGMCGRTSDNASTSDDLPEKWVPEIAIRIFGLIKNETSSA